MKQGVIIDTGVLVAFLSKNDTHHPWAVSQLKNIQPPLLTCEAVVSEVSFLTQRHKQGMAVIFSYLKLGIIETPFRFSAEYEAIEKLMLKYSNVPMSFADACLVKMSEQKAIVVFSLWTATFKFTAKTAMKPFRLFILVGIERITASGGLP